LSGHRLAEKGPLGECHWLGQCAKVQDESRHRATVDDGGAPNFERPFCTVGLCKPQIRSTLNKETWSPRLRGESSVQSHTPFDGLASVSEKLTFAEYWRDPRFGGKKPKAAASMPDNIYRPQGADLVQVDNLKHGPGEQAEGFERSVRPRF
jgi:putative DNA base modification enzyme with NMAD domain